MTHQPSLLDQNSQTEPSPKRLQSWSSKMKNEKRAQIAFFVRQCYDILNTYARDATSLKNITQGFVQVIEQWDNQDIEAAFAQWLAEKPAMPTPSDISAICAGLSKAREDAKNRRPLGQLQWKQRVLDRSTDDLIEEFFDGQHLSPLQLDQRFSDRNFYVRMGHQ